MKISKNKKMRLDPKIKFLDQKVCSVFFLNVNKMLGTFFWVVALVFVKRFFFDLFFIKDLFFLRRIVGGDCMQELRARLNQEWKYSLEYLIMILYILSTNQK